MSRVAIIASSLYLAVCFVVGGVIGMHFRDDDFAEESDPPEQIEAADSPAPATRAECIPCNGEGHTCGKMCQYCKGYGTVPIVRLTMYPDKSDEQDEPDCQVKILSSLRKAPLK